MSPALGRSGPSAVRQRWALLIGISGYAHEKLRLEYAARDAQRLREVLLQPTAGSFADDHVLLLSDANATLAELTKALRTFLKRPGRDDLVLLFFACHGAHDPERPDNLYLLPHDTDPADISGTALPMREVDLALKETLVSQRVVVFMDSCHSGGVGGGFRAHEAAAADFNRYMAELSDARGGVSVLTSAMANEGALEGEQWGQGHGVFTHFVLEGLKGKADAEPRDGIVTVGELFDYVTEQVKQATGDRQHPHMSGSSDRELVLAVMGASSADEHLRLAAALASAAEWLDEPICWLGAAAQRQAAQRLRADTHDVALATTIALELARGGDLDAAQRCLAALPRDEADVRALIGLTELAQGRSGDARATLLAPTAAAPWVARLLAPPPAVTGRRVVLLVALDAVDPAAYGGWDGALKSAVAEARAFGERLRERFGFDETIELFDRQATAGGLRRTLGELLLRSAQFDALVVMLSGHGGEVPDANAKERREGTFCCFDAQLTSADIDALLRRSQAARTTLVVSSAHSGHFVERARAGGYEAMSSCAADQLDYEGVHFSFFVEALLSHLGPDTEGQALSAAVADAVKKLVPRMGTVTQVPQFALAEGTPPLVVQRQQSADAAAAATARALLGTAAASDAVLDAALAWMAQDDAPQRLAGALVAPARLRAALQPRLAALAPLPQASSVQWCAAACATVRRASAAQCGPALEQLAQRCAGEPALLHSLQDLMLAVAEAGTVAQRLRVLLVDVSGGGDALTALRASLLACGVAARRIATLAGAEATAPRVRAALQRAGRAPPQPVLLYWVGRGDLGALRCHGDSILGLTEIAGILGGAATLLADGIDDSAPLERMEAGHTAAITVLLRPAHGGDGKPVRGKRSRRAAPEQRASATFALMAALTAALERNGHDLAALRAGDLDGAGLGLVVRANAAAPLIADPLADAVDAFAARLREAELTRAAAQLEAWLELRGGADGMVQLQLGVLRDALGQPDAALAALERALVLLAAQAGQQPALARARLMLGRVLLGSGRDRARAVSECRIAAELDPKLDAALYWRGRAIAELVRRETLAEASEALTTYLSRGAAIGRREETLRLLQQLGDALPREAKR